MSSNVLLENSMHRILKLFAFVLVVAVTCYVSFRLGASRSDKDAFDRGSKLAKERSALFRAADSNHLVNLYEAGRNDEVRRIVENGMWISIVPMDELLRNPDASEEDRERVSNVLPRLIEYYYKNPKKIEAPTKSEISEGVSTRLDAEAKSTGTDPDKKEILGELNDASKKPLEQLDGMFDAYLSEAHKFDLETQRVIDRHIAQRNFPGRTQSAAGITFMMPRDSGGGGSSDNEFHFNGKKLRVLYEAGNLQVNGQDFGTIAKGDTVDLRLLGHVYVNNIERHPQKQEAEQAGTGQSATRPESKSEGGDKPQPESEGRSR